MHDLTAERIADLRLERDRCMKAARVARALQCDDLTIDMVCEARDLHDQLMRARREQKTARARDTLRDPQSLTDAELQALLSVAIASHHAPRRAYAARAA